MLDLHFTLETFEFYLHLAWGTPFYYK